MTLEKKPRGRGRPRAFDRDAAIAAAQALFQRDGYDAVGIPDLCAAMGIGQPAFFSAFGSKNALFARVLARYDTEGAGLLAAMLTRDGPTAAVLAAMLVDVADRYTADPAMRGCLTLDSTSCGDAAMRAAANEASDRTRATVERFVAARLGAAEEVVDLVIVALAGLSSAARRGLPRDRLMAVARSYAPAITAAVAARAGVRAV